MQSFYPEKIENLQEIIANAVADKTALKIEGAATLDAVGHPVMAQYSVNMHKCRGIIDYDPAELVLVVRAGTPLIEIEAMLASENQFLAFEPPHFNKLFDNKSTSTSQTIGGVVGAGLAGSRRVSAGSARDYLLGFTAVSGRAEVFKSGSRVMKNVTGYDLSKLMSGSFGTLAIMDEITLKVLPAPEIVNSCVIAASDLKSAQQIISQVFASPVEASGGVVLPEKSALAVSLDIGNHAAAAIIRIEGIQVSVTDRINQIKSMMPTTQEIHILENTESRNLWRSVCDCLPLADAEQIWRISVPPSKGPALFDAVSRSTEISGFLDWAGGLVWIAGNNKELHQIIRSQIAFHGGGHATLFKADISLRSTLSVFQPLPAALHALEMRVRNAFDPCQILNPMRTQPSIEI